VTSPFTLVETYRDKRAAEALASAFAVSTDMAEVYACLRFHWRQHCLSGAKFSPADYDLFGYLNGSCFAAFQDELHRNLPEGSFKPLKDAAWSYLDRKDIAA
jgi:hypothetical protein